MVMLGDMVANGGLSEPTHSLRESKGRRRNNAERERERLEREFINLKLYHSATITSYK